MFDKVSTEVVGVRKSIRQPEFYFNFKIEMAVVHILVVVYQLWCAQPHHLPNILEKEIFWAKCPSHAKHRA